MPSNPRFRWAVEVPFTSGGQVSREVYACLGSIPRSRLYVDTFLQGVSGKYLAFCALSYQNGVLRRNVNGAGESATGWFEVAKGGEPKRPETFRPFRNETLKTPTCGIAIHDKRSTSTATLWSGSFVAPCCVSYVFLDEDH